MAKQRFGINDAYRGTVGTVIGYEWRGKWCLRARPLRVRNPRTEKQQSNRMVFKQAVALAGSMKLALRKGLHNVSMGLHITECNLFFKRNKGCFSLDTLGGSDSSPVSVDWENLIISEGSLAVPVFLKPVSNIADGGSWSSSPKLGEGDRREAVVEECVRNGSGIPNLSRSVSDFSTHSSVSRQAAASSPNLGEQPKCYSLSSAMSRSVLDSLKSEFYSAGSDGGGSSSSPKLGEGDRRAAVVEECVRNERWIRSVPDFSTHSSVSRRAAASSPNLGEQPKCYSLSPAMSKSVPDSLKSEFYIAGSDGGSGSPSKFAPLRSHAVSPAEPGREGVDAKRTGACVFYPVSISADRRAAVVEECVRNERYITFPFAPCCEGEKACGDDEVYVYAYCPEAAEGVLSAPAWRRGGSVRLTLPERWQGMEVHFYGFAVDLDGEASETVYIGKLERVETRPAMSDTRPRQPQAAATPSLPGSAGDMACDRSGANLEGEFDASHPASLMHSSLEEGTAQEAFIDGWHNICRSDYVINEKQSQLWQIRKNSKTLSSTFIPTWPREPIAISSLSVTLPLR